MYSSRACRSTSEVSNTPPSSAVSFLLKVDGTLEEVQRNHAVESLELDTVALDLTLTEDTLGSKEVKAEALSTVVEGLSGDNCKHNIIL